MDFDKLIDNLDPTIYESLKRAVEIGKWPDGRRLTAQQRERCMEAVIAYDFRRKPEAERVGYVDMGSKAQGDVCGDHEHDKDSDGEKPLKWLE